MNTKFPLQQGALDELCSLYAIVNFLHLVCEGQFSVEHAAAVFNNAIAVISNDEEGNLEALLTKGINRKDFDWLYKALDGVSRAPALTWQKKQKGTELTISGVNLPAIIYFRVKPSPIRNFTHYSVVKTVNEDGDLSLFDSYGFGSIIHVNQKYFVLHDDGSRGEVTLEGIWSIAN